MASFHDLLGQLHHAHETDMAELRSQVEVLQRQLDDELEGDVESPVRDKSMVLEACHEAPLPVMDEEALEPIIKIFGADVTHLGLRILWSERPRVQRVVQGTAGAAAGVQSGDLLVGINGIETSGRSREDLLSQLRQRPLTLELLRPTVAFGTAQQSLYHLQSSSSQVDVLTAPATPRRQRARLDAVKEESARVEVRSPSKPSQGAYQSEDEKLPSHISNYSFINRNSPVSPKEAKTSEGTQTYLGLRRFITSRKESTASVAHLGIGNWKLSMHEDQNSTKMTLHRAFHSLVKWWTHLAEPERGSCAAQFLESQFFGSFCSTVILMHAVVVTMSADFEVNNLGATPPESLSLMELIFLGFYAFELALRLWVHRCFFFVGENAGWNWFDFFLVAMSLFDVSFLIMAQSQTASAETGGNVSFMRLFRLFKITKILRTIRIIKVFRELSMMVESFTKCIVAMFWGLVLLVFLLYIFALVFVQGITDLLRNTQLTETGQQEVEAQFGSVLKSMLSLYMAVTGGNDWSMYFDTLSQCGLFYTILFLLFNFFFVFALFNIMTGVFVERALTAAIPDRDELIWEEQKKLAKQVEDFKLLCKEFDTDGSGLITREEFRMHMRNDAMVSYMASVGLEMHDVEHFFRTVAGEDSEVTIDRFVEGCMAMRGHATALDAQRQLFESKRLEDNLNAFRKESRENLSKVERLLLKALNRATEEERNSAKG